MQNISQVKAYLDKKAKQYNTLEFIAQDPIQIPHQYNHKNDIEIAAFFAAILAWGNRKTIINKTTQLFDLMDNSPYDFVVNHQTKDLQIFNHFKHRTFNNQDIQFLVQALQNICLQHQSLEPLFTINENETNPFYAIERFRKQLFKTKHLTRSQKHISSPAKGSAAKRLNMLLRWMVRKDKSGVDFGIWQSIPMAKLSCPLDIHSGNTARQIGLLTRKQNDWKAVQELDANLRTLNPTDPVLYDFALFGLGVNL